MSTVARVGIAIAAALVLSWLAGVGVLWLAGRRRRPPAEALRLLPDLVRVVSRLARDSRVPRGVRARLWLLIGYLALPFDLVPDFIPVVGYLDDAVLVALVLRSTVRRAGPDLVAEHWPGTPDGLRAVLRLAGA